MGHPPRHDGQLRTHSGLVGDHSVPGRAATDAVATVSGVAPACGCSEPPLDPPGPIATSRTATASPAPAVVHVQRGENSHFGTYSALKALQGCSYSTGSTRSSRLRHRPSARPPSTGGPRRHSSSPTCRPDEPSAYAHAPLATSRSCG